MADRFNEIAERVVLVLPDGPERWCVMIGESGTVAHRGALADCEMIADCHRETIAAAIRAASDDAFECGFDCAFDIAETNVATFADNVARPPSVFGKDVTPEMRDRICDLRREQGRAVRDAGKALRAARDRLTAERDRARKGSGT